MEPKAKETMVEMVVVFLGLLLLLIGEEILWVVVVVVPEAQELLPQ
jgi:hypothetical protein